MENTQRIWAMLVHMGFNFWNEEGNYTLRSDSNVAKSYVRFDRNLWQAYTEYLRKLGANMLVIDVGEALQYPSHPELAVEGSWTPEQLCGELDRLHSMGFEVVPKLNFSASHDIWLKEYSRMLSTSVYYQVCDDLIRDVCEIFKPRFLHLGMDEETFSHQRRLDYIVIRQHDQWWKDLYKLTESVEKQNVRPWMWSDYAWEHGEEYVHKMPRSVVQSNWFYQIVPGYDEALYAHKLRTLTLLHENGFDQIPTGSSVFCTDNMQALVEHCDKTIPGEHLLGYMQSSWRHFHEAYREKLWESADQLANAISTKG